MFKFIVIIVSVLGLAVLLSPLLTAVTIFTNVTSFL